MLAKLLFYPSIFGDFQNMLRTQRVNEHSMRKMFWAETT